MKLRKVHWLAVVALVVMMLVAGRTALRPAVVSAQDVAAPIPYPEPNDIGLGGAEVTKLPIDQIVTYMALPEYHQAPSLDAFVESGELPPDDIPAVPYR